MKLLACVTCPIQTELKRGNRPIFEQLCKSPDETISRLWRKFLRNNCSDRTVSTIFGKHRDLFIASKVNTAFTLKISPKRVLTHASSCRIYLRVNNFRRRVLVHALDVFASYVTPFELVITFKRKSSCNCKYLQVCCSTHRSLPIRTR